MKLLGRAEVVSLLTKCRSTGSVFDVELVVRAERAGIGVAELPVSIAERRPGEERSAYPVGRALLARPGRESGRSSLAELHHVDRHRSGRDPWRGQGTGRAEPLTARRAPASRP